jgi:SET domain-containing protein 6
LTYWHLLTHTQVNELEDEEIEDSFVIDRDMEEPDSKGDVHGEMKLKHLPADLEEQINTFLKAVRKASPESIPDKRKRDEISLSTMHRVLELRLAQYATSEAQDLTLTWDQRLSARQKMAICVRVGEKKLLQEAINLAAEKLNTINGSGAEASQHSTKRQRTS